MAIERLTAACALLSFVCACGSEDAEKPSSNGPPTYPGAQPCNIDSGYEGDEYCILPPAEGEGFQLHYGPKSYDQAEIDKYLIQPGEEVTDCMFVKTPNDKEVFINQYHARMRPGSHHMITYLTDKAVPDSAVPEECGLDANMRFLVGAQEKVIDVLADEQAPEQEGYAMKLPANQQAAIQLHYVNTGTEPILKETWVNVLFTDPATVTTLVDPLFWLGGLGIAIPPNSQHLTQASCVVNDTMPEGLHLLQITGHYHAHTKRFSAWLVRGSTGEKHLLYESYDFNEPGFAYFNSADVNPKPDPATRSPGGEWNGPLFLEPGDAVQWECEVDNTSNGTLEFANGAYTAEMCNVFGTYAPSMGEPWSCINF